ncbi:hypothetical protein [Polyangium aurulentum]|uniref:hypothetical protein n=1 Tax=Polyangium aurulentum TaxID=2567896 RepID=UPI0010ADC976|nr:hypothetical protein [Polyangium aurulentum]UQA61363.1 hypothetical protein E8A73_013165 [Polyangium aurulentum]
MSLEAWQQLEELEKYIHEHFDNGDCPKQGCPPGPRVHIVYAHYAALPDTTRNVLDAWVFPTLEKYDECKAQQKPRSLRAAMDFLGSHFLWVRAPDVQFKGLPAPPTEEDIEPTLKADGGTLIHFISTKFPTLKSTAQDAQAKQTPARPISVTTPLLIDDPQFIQQSNETVVTKTHTKTAKEKDDKTLSKKGPEASSPAAQAPPTAGQVEHGEGYPLYRRLCFSLAGKPGEHQLVNAEGVTTATVQFAYHQETSHAALRLFCVSPGFKFELRKGGKSPAPAAPDGQPTSADPSAPTETSPAAGTLKDEGDPWARSTRAGKYGDQLWETTTNLWVGTITRYGSTHGLGKPLAEGDDHPGPRLTTTQDLGTRFAAQLGRSRSIVFRAVRGVEGPCEAIQTYDSGLLSWGINQWTANSQELWHILAFIYDFFPQAFARRFAYYGIGAWFSGRSINWSNLRLPYREVCPYRVPCCGSGVEVALKAVLEDWAKAEAIAKKKAEQRAIAAKGKKATDAASPPPPPRDPIDLPPRRMRYLAEKLKIKGAEWYSYAMCYVFTTAGADPEIQMAMAQWMSYRITSIDPKGKTIGVVIREFLDSLRPSAAELDKRMIKAMDALRDDFLPEAQKEAEAQFGDEKLKELEAKLEDAKAQAANNPKLPTTTKKPKARVDPQVAAAQAALDQAKTTIERAAAKLAVQRRDALIAEPFSDDDADEAWISWPKRCADAGKRRSAN